ncbi:hypothetical protein PCYB_003440 [Plasmodium cynomolgi strain B]|uniref:CYIR protein n=1 Tax=Plasmodium cynomolgi (strain B) TaxID=1120755 RepID=K6V2S9_PLACD|nr:hypothetical protein PCYB_003440 [Plasmodium cynomolgi strain B]GAB69595.1 hypothetical protein PCYB_003440 [Plasmodium cynomolgi strain B]
MYKTFKKFETFKNSKKHSYKNNPEYCVYLYHWLYKVTEGSNISDTFIGIIFKVFHENFSDLKEEHICPYYLYEYKKEIYKSKDLVKLSYLQHNVVDIMKILKNTKDKDYCYCQKYLKDCVDIYIEMMRRLCPDNEEGNDSSEIICPELIKFRVNYNFLTKDNKIEKEIPHIDTGERELELLNCPLKGERSGLISDARPSSDAAASQALSNVKTLPIALGTISGVTSILALLYKFTPLGLWINTKILGRDKLLDNIKKNEQQFLLNTAHIRDINSGDTIYRIKYNSVLNE